MKITKIFVGLVLLNFGVKVQCQEIFTKNNKTLIITNEDPTLNADVKKGLIEVFFKTYPKIVKDFNQNATDTVKVKIDTIYKGVAYANNGEITISSKWMHKKPEDLDVITHEGMHLVQAYPQSSGPGWLTEGIADYARYKYGVYNEKAGWSLTPFSPKQSYTDSYRITARFLEWISENYDEYIVKKLDEKMRSEKYALRLWQKYTGKTLDELWKEYSEKPKLI